jgi:hypothetical protein
MKMKKYAGFGDYLDDQPPKNRSIIRARHFVKRVSPDSRRAAKLSAYWFERARWTGSFDFSGQAASLAEDEGYWCGFRVHWCADWRQRAGG